MHPAVGVFLQRCVRDFVPDGPVLEIGSLNVNGSAREFFRGRTYLGIDLVAGPGVDLVADGADYVPSEPPHAVVCCEALEHTPRVDQIVRNVISFLPRGGVFIITCATDYRIPHSAVDGGQLRPGEYYRNVQLEDLAGLEALETLVLEIDRLAGDLRYCGRKRP